MTVSPSSAAKLSISCATPAINSSIGSWASELILSLLAAFSLACSVCLLYFLTWFSWLVVSFCNRPRPCRPDHAQFYGRNVRFRQPSSTTMLGENAQDFGPCERLARHLGLLR